MTVPRTAVGWCAKSSITAMPAASPRSSWRRLMPLKSTIARAACSGGRPRLAQTAIAPSTFSTLCLPNSGMRTRAARSSRFHTVNCVPSGSNATSDTRHSAPSRKP